MSEHEENGGGALMVRPQVQATPAGALVGVSAERQRAVAEIQASIMAARSFPRDELRSLDRIKNACQRFALAEKAEYSYNRGGQEVRGPTIDLMTVIANHWGNVSYGFRELSQTIGVNGACGESTVEAYAWDLETNTKRVATFTVAHKRVSKRGVTLVTDPREVYEVVANYSMRRVRSCLEAVIPSDVIEVAVAECRETVKKDVKLTRERIQDMIAKFGELGVTKEAIEKRVGRRADAIEAAQFVSLGRVYKSIKDGMSEPAEWFELEDRPTPGPASAAEAAKEMMRRRGEPARPEPAAAREPGGEG